MKKLKSITAPDWIRRRPIIRHRAFRGREERMIISTQLYYNRYNISVVGGPMCKSFVRIWTDALCLCFVYRVIRFVYAAYRVVVLYLFFFFYTIANCFFFFFYLFPPSLSCVFIDFVGIWVILIAANSTVVYTSALTKALGNNVDLQCFASTKCVAFDVFRRSRKWPAPRQIRWDLRDPTINLRLRLNYNRNNNNNSYPNLNNNNNSSSHLTRLSLCHHKIIHRASPVRRRLRTCSKARRRFLLQAFR